MARRPSDPEVARVKVNWRLLESCRTSLDVNNLFTDMVNIIPKSWKCSNGGLPLHNDRMWRESNVLAERDLVGCTSHEDFGIARPPLNRMHGLNVWGAQHRQEPQREQAQLLDRSPTMPLAYHRQDRLYEGAEVVVAECAETGIPTV